MTLSGPRGRSLAPDSKSDGLISLLVCSAEQGGGRGRESRERWEDKVGERIRYQMGEGGERESSPSLLIIRLWLAGDGRSAVIPQILWDSRITRLWV